MQKITILFFILFLFQNVHASITKDDAIRFNVLMSAALSNYYCETGAWPKNLEVLFEFEKNHDVPYNKMNNEDWGYVIKQTEYINPLEGGGVGYSAEFGETGEQMILSKHSTPNCNETDPKKRLSVKIIIKD